MATSSFSRIELDEIMNCVIKHCSDGKCLAKYPEASCLGCSLLATRKTKKSYLEKVSLKQGTKKFSKEAKAGT